MRRGMLGYYAGFISRLIAFVVDLALVAVAVSATIWIVATAWSMLQFSALVDLLRIPDPNALLNLQLVAGIFATSVYVLYHIFFLSTTGRTPGKAFMGLRVVTTDGKRLPFPRVLVRLVGYMVSVVPLFLGFAWILADDRRQGFHDKLAGTYVVYAWSARPDERFLAYELERLAPPEG